MARTKDPHAAAVKSWLTRTRAQNPARGTVVQSGADFAKRGAPSIHGMTVDSPEVKAEADRLHRAAVEMEPEITKLVTSIAKATGGKAEGLAFRLKAPAAIAGKIMRDVVEKNVSPAEAASQLSDINRYTITYDPKTLVAQGKAAIAALKEAGWSPYDHKLKNFFVPGDAYDGFNGVYENKDGARFELQFHTPESIKIKEVAHKIFERWRETPPSPARDTMWSQMTGLWNNYERPANWDQLPGTRAAQA